jgi:hypothetical protein
MIASSVPPISGHRLTIRLAALTVIGLLLCLVLWRRRR